MAPEGVLWSRPVYLGHILPLCAHAAGLSALFWPQRPSQYSIRIDWGWFQRAWSVHGVSKGMVPRSCHFRTRGPEDRAPARRHPRLKGSPQGKKARSRVSRSMIGRMITGDSWVGYHFTEPKESISHQSAGSPLKPASPAGGLPIEIRCRSKFKQVSLARMNKTPETHLRGHFVQTGIPS